ncbi:MAG: hypothetical protein A3J24_11195 [Deltaproteobacteria bacterium RIFCSPLOWO2_02_FULL_53_8]|nr:MAG: hypothetical protein A3J24_11195 [Deltaproteobacteria bacterium RIFCSPLOWO2_02_FULL_53_8]
MRQSEHVLYITLVDFLIQLIFMGLIIGVIYAATQWDETNEFDPRSGEEALKQVEHIKVLTGISDLTKLTDELTRLAPLQAASKYAAMGRDLELAVSAVGGVPEAKKALEEQTRKTAGQGKPSCLLNGAIVATFDAFEDRIEVQRPFTPEFEKLLAELGLRDQIAPLPLATFKNTFAPLLSNHPACRYNAKVVEHSTDTRPRDAVSSAFWLKKIERLR